MNGTQGRPACNFFMRRLKAQARCTGQMHRPHALDTQAGSARAAHRSDWSIGGSDDQYASQQSDATSAACERKKVLAARQRPTPPPPNRRA
eukprot:6182890-Pleurochrysis_carterae.AAC.3